MRNPRRNGSAALRMPAVLVVAAVAVAGSAAIPGSAAAGQGEPATFTKDVAPILQRSCQQCHRPNSLAPMSLLSYEEARPWARSIKYRTGLRTQPGAMPPWYVEKDIGIQAYKNDPSLTDDEIATIAAWVDGGAPRGDPADMPPPLTFSAEDAWELGEPDLVLTTESVEMAAGAPDWWGPFGEIPTGLTEDRYVAAVEMREINDLGGRLGGRTVGGRFVFHHLCWGTIAADGETRTRYPCHEVAATPTSSIPTRAGRWASGRRRRSTPSTCTRAARTPGPTWRSASSSTREATSRASPTAAWACSATA